MLGIAVILSVGIFLLAFNSHLKKKNGKSNLAMILIGWTIIAACIIGLVISFVIFIDSSLDSFSMLLLMILSPLVIIAGVISMLSYGASSLAQGLTKDDNGLRNKEAIVRGAFILFLAVALTVTIIISAGLLLKNHTGNIGAM